MAHYPLTGSGVDDSCDEWVQKRLIHISMERGGVIILERPDYLHFIPPEQKEILLDTQSSMMEWATDREQT